MSVRICGTMPCCGRLKVSGKLTSTLIKRAISLRYHGSSRCYPASWHHRYHRHDRFKLPAGLAPADSGTSARVAHRLAFHLGPSRQTVDVDETNCGGVIEFVLC